MAVLVPITAQAQSSRSYIKESIRKWGKCRNVCITRTGGDIALDGRNAYSYKDIPSDLSRAIKEEHDDQSYIDDIQLTENGNWLMLIGNNGFRWNNIPSALERKLHEYHDADEVVTSVTFNDADDWIIISRGRYAASPAWVADFIEEGCDKYGSVWTAHLTDDGLVVVFERGYRFYGNVPQALKDALDETDLDVVRLKFTSDGAYFFADSDGNYEGFL